MNKEFKTDYQTYIHRSRYARWRDKDSRRETWEETVSRYFDFFKDYLSEKPGDLQNDSLFSDAKAAVLSLSVMPSMRALMTAGPALTRDNVSGYNCSYIAMDNLRAFDELMYILMCGTGVGFSVERQYVAQLPTIAEELHETKTTLSVRDSKIGWASAYKELISLLYSGQIPQWDLSKLRPAGTRLRTFGGRSSGPGPLDELFKFTISTFRAAVGRKLSSMEVHDIVCKIADVVVVGGVRRSALISLSNLTDERLRMAKTGQWWETNPQRALANNSIAYTEKPDVHSFLKEWSTLYDSKSGERGIFYRKASQTQAAKNGRRDASYEFGTNPCSEIILRSNEFCNLTEVVIRSDDTLDILLDKVQVASFLGTIQSNLTDFRYLSSKWKRNCEEERLLGVSLTGILDHPILAVPSAQCAAWLQEMRNVAIRTNKEFSARLGILPSAAVTCVKPSGTVSQLVDCSSGIHPRYASHYIRTVRNSSTDPIAQFLMSAGVPYEPEIGKEASSIVFSFPVEAPAEATLRNSLSALDQLNLWLHYNENWCEHKPSITVYVREEEWLDAGAWVYRNFETLSGVSFLPYDDHAYKQAPYQPVSQEEYIKLISDFPVINWDEFKETEDTNTVNHDLACSAGVCEL